MAGPECVVDVKLTELGELLREACVRALLSRVEPGVFQHEDAVVTKVLGELASAPADAVVRVDHFTT